MSLLGTFYYYFLFVFSIVRNLHS